MRKLFVTALAGAILGSMATSQQTNAVSEIPPRKGEAEVVAVFNGKNLDGWEGHEKYWSVKDGVIVARNTEKVPVSTYLLTKRKFSDFRFKVTAKLVESKMHSGVCFWGRVAPEHKDEYTYAGHLVMFPAPWGMYDLYGRAGKLGVDPKPGQEVGKETDWNDIDIVARGNRVRVLINDVLVIDWREPEPERIKEGPIGLQLHSNTVPQEVHFRNLSLVTFPTEEHLKDLPTKIGEKRLTGK
jgi:hypothetical protein